MENNQIAEQVVDNAQQSNTNGIPGSLPGETKAETAQRLYKVTVDGQDMEVDENELRRGYTHSKAAAKRMEEASMTRKEAESVLRLMRENPKQAMKQLGLDPRQFAELVINEELSEALLSPQERELRDYKQKVDQYENERRYAQKQYEEQQMESEIQRQAESIQNEIISVLDVAGLPKTERTVSRIVYYMQSALQAGYNVSPKDVIEQVKQDYKYDLNSMLGGLPEEALKDFLEAGVFSKVAKSTVKGSRAPNGVARSINENRTEKKEGKKVLAPKDFFKRF